MPDLLMLGAGGHARVVARLLHHDARWNVVGVLDAKPPRADERIGGHGVVGTFDDLGGWLTRGVRHVVLAIGDNQRRADMHDRARQLGFQIVGLRHPSVLVEQGASIAADAVLGIGSIVCADAQIGSNVLVNSGAIVDHECVIEQHAHVAPGTRLAGRVHLGEGAFLGLGSVVRDGRRIGAGAVIGAGSVVVEDIPAGVVAFGVPARVQPGKQSSWTRSG